MAKKPAKVRTTEVISKADAARAAISEGHDTPQPAVAYIKSKFGIEMSPMHFSAVKSQINKKKGTHTVALKGRPKKSAKVTVTPPSKKQAGDDTLLEVLEALKPLVASLGVEKVKRLTDLLA